MKQLFGTLAGGLALILGACTSTSVPEEVSQQDIALGIIEQGLIGGDIEYINTHVAEDYIQHNPLAQDGRAGLVGFTSYLQTLEGTTGVTPVRVLEDGELVAVHAVYEFGGQKNVVFDIFRFEDGLAVQHWDGTQAWAEETVSGRSMIDGPTQISSQADTEATRSLVENFVTDILVEGKSDRLTTYIGDVYLQHNPQIGDNLEGLGVFIGGLQEQGISFGYSKIHKIVAEGDFALVQSEGQIGGAPMAFYDLFRVEDGMIVEHWDVIQPIPETMPHENGMF
ncbi:MAG: nuclear transport factor 2 family protein [Hyphomonadaceae bacterium]|nr:nuclear transport factor 2 family protein [Hyphomonadaceae bacterium]